MKRERHSRSHAAVALGQLFKGFDRFGVTQNDGDLTPLGAVSRCAGRSVFGFVHGLARKAAHVVQALRVRLPAGELFRLELAAFLGRRGDGEGSLLDGNTDGLARLGAKGGGEVSGFGDGVHVRLRLLTVGTSYPVTSDKSTLTDTVRREVS